MNDPSVWQIITVLALLTIPIIPNLWSIWHAFHRAFPTDTERLAWLGIAVFVPVLGGIAYIIFGRPRARKPGAEEPERG